MVCVCAREREREREYTCIFCTCIFCVSSRGLTYVYIVHTNTHFMYAF